MTNKMHVTDLILEFDTLKFSGKEMPVDFGVITHRPHGHEDKLLIRIESGIATGREAFAMSEDFPGTGHERALFNSRARVKQKIFFKLHIVNSIGIRVRPLPIEPNQ